MIKTFRGLLNKGASERIRLETRDGKTGFRIKFLSGMPADTSAGSNEATIQVYATKQTSTSTTVSFSEATLLGCFYFLRDQGVVAINSQATIFEETVFNQDIFVHYEDGQNNTAGFNFYLELEHISLDDMEATTVILKNFRHTNTVA